MTYKKNTYYEEIKSFFGDKVSQKKGKEIAHELKLFQVKFFPEKTFKDTLFQDLENSYLFDEATENMQHFSFFRVLSTVFSFVFIFTVVYAIYDIRHTPLVREYIVPESANIVQQDRIVESSGEGIEIDEELLQDYTPLSQEELGSETDIQQKTNIEIETQVETKIELEFTISKQRDNEQKQTTETQVFESQVQKEPSVQNMRKAPLEEQDTPESSPMMMDMSMDMMDDFIQMCETEGGQISEDANTCTFIDGRQCQRDTSDACFSQ